jgi:Domain of unknown function (DUF6458)
MPLGLGIVLLLAGLILVLEVVTYDLPYVADETLGWLLILVGALTVVLTLALGAVRSRRATIEEHHYEHDARG